MIRKNAIYLIFAAAMTMALLLSLLLTPVTSYVRADGGATPTPTQVSGDSGASGGGNTGG